MTNLWSKVLISLFLGLHSGCVWRGNDPFFSVWTATPEFLTGGLAVWDHRAFEKTDSHTIPASVNSSISLDSKPIGVWIPFVIHYYHDAAPHEVRLRFDDPQRQYVRIEIHEMIVDYPNQKRTVQKVDWSSSLNLENEDGAESSSNAWQLDAELKQRIEGHADVSVVLIGHLTDRDGQRIPFESRGSFRADSKTGVLTFWYFASHVT